MLFRQPRSGFNRVPFVQSCTLAWEGVESASLVCNLSILGVYIHLDHLGVPLERDHEVTLRFRLPDGGPEIEAVAGVTWVNDVAPADGTGLPRGCGLRFLRVAPDDLRRIAALVSSFLAAPQEQAAVGVGQPFTGRPRIPFIAACTLTGKFGTRQGSLCNLSVVGVYVALADIPATGARGRISFEIPGATPQFAADFRVTWQNPAFPVRAHALPPGCGLCFEHLGEREEGLLIGLVSAYQLAQAN